jgi:glycerate 2-kinase
MMRVFFVTAIPETPRAQLEALFHTAVARADPMHVLAPYLPALPHGRLLIIGAGKASARMAEAVEVHYGPCDGIVITRYGYGRTTKGIEIIEAAHPVPDAAGVAATKRMLDLVRELGPDDLVIALISGGGSSLLCAPVDGLTLMDKQALNAGLLASGAPIGQMNRVRQQVSRVKGGKLALACAPARVLNLIISDVPGDDPAEVASGPTVGARAGGVEALEILDKWGVVVIENVRNAIAAAPQPLPVDDPALAHVETVIVAAPSQSLDAAGVLAQSWGWDVRQIGDALEGEARELAFAQADAAMTIAGQMQSGDAPVLLLSGGECTVTRRGDGVGGPNAEFALAASLRLQGNIQIHVIACDTDGVDGAADIAGAYVSPRTLALAKKVGVDPKLALATNDAHHFFGRIEGQIITGPTLTNVNDFRAFLILPPDTAA